MNCEVKTFREQHLVLGCIVVSVSIGGTAHQEHAGWNPGEFHPQIVGGKWSDWLTPGRRKAPQAVFELAAVRNFDRLGQGMQQPDQLGTRITLLFKPVGEDQPQGGTLGMFLHRLCEGGFVVHGLPALTDLILMWSLRIVQSVV
jgi:hypothetical protein